MDYIIKNLTIKFFKYIDFRQRDKEVNFDMKCQFCNTNEADKIFYTNYMGALYQIPVCEGCLRRMWQQAVAAGQAEAYRNYAGWWPGRPEPRRLGERAFPDQAEEDLKRKRQLAVLKVRLQEAAKKENYEEAARLRDDIATMEKEVCSHEG